MGKNRLWTALWFCDFVCVPVFGFECPYKECVCIETDITCTDKGLMSVPEIVSTNTVGLTSLTFEFNQITVIPAGSLPSNLTKISLEFNPTTTIDETAFDGSSNTLEILSFYKDRFTKIPDALYHLKVLKELSFRHTSITDWDVDVMKHVGLTLERLFLENAGIMTMPSWIQYFSHLTDLTMDSCFVSALPDNALDMLTDRLTFLSLFNNSLTEVPKTIYKLSVLTDLNLGNNQISNITWLPQTNLSSLNLNNNNISDANLLSRILRPSADSLVTLTLQVNKLTVIPELGFLLHVGELDLTYNILQDPYSGSVPANLYSLDLENNFLPVIPRVMSNLTHLSTMILTFNAVKEIKGTDFPSSVIWVWLDHNLITELNDASFPENSTIQYMYLNNNPIIKMSNLAFKNLPHLSYLTLGGTKLTRLPLALASLSSLYFLDATDNTHLVCTCMEKSLGPFFESLAPGNVQGDCGYTSIYYFFAILSSGCPTP